MINNIKTVWSMIDQMREILTNKQKKQLVIVLFCIIIAALFEMLGVSAVIPFIYAILSPEEIMKNDIVSGILRILNITNSKDMLLLIGVFIIAIYIFKNLLLLLSSYIQIWYRCGVMKELSTSMLKDYMKRPYSYFININSSEILRGLNRDVVNVQLLIESFCRICSDGLTFLLIASFIIYTDWRMAVGIIGAGISCVFVISVGFKSKMKTAGTKYREADAEKNKSAYEAITGIKEITVTRRRDAFASKYEKAYEVTRKYDIQSSFMTECPTKIIELVLVTCLIITIFIRMGQGVNASNFVPQLAAFALSAVRLLPAVSSITSHASRLVFLRPSLQGVYENVIAARNIQNEEYFELLDMTKKGELSFDKGITIDNITWVYPGNNRAVLNNINLEIRKGDTIGIIGESGAGKTTFIDAVLGLLQPQEGRILLDNEIDIFSIPKRWAEIIGYVPQNVFLLDDTIRNNIVFGADRCNDAMIWEALEQAQLKTFVEQLPLGLDTILGERGIKFSGGQRQRIAIARALYQNPDILVLDEATSALDNDTEEALMEAINLLQGKKTLIIVAHRLSTIEKCNKIYRIEKGKVYCERE